MKLFRTVVFWMHLCCGVFAGAIVLTMSVTGVLLTYEQQLQKWEAGGSIAGPVPDDVEPLPLEELLIAARGEREGVPSDLTISSDPLKAVTIRWGRDGSAMLNPYTAELIPATPTTVREGLSTLRTWHRWLGQEGDSRAFGRSITGVCNLAFLFIVVSGIYLWWPKKWTVQNVKAVALFRGGLTGKARDFNWHNVIGLWSMIPLFFIVFSGAVISYPWVSNLVYHAFGENPPVRSSEEPSDVEAAELPIIEGLPLSAYVEQAQQAEPTWQTIRVSLPKDTDETLTIAIDRGSGRQPHLQSTLTLDRKTASVTEEHRLGDYTPGYRARRILRFLHTGEVLGPLGQTLAGIVSAGAAVLVWTGIALTWRRFRVWVARRANA